MSKYNCLGKQATSTQAFTEQFPFLIFHCNCFLLIWMLKCSIGLQGQTLMNQIAGEKIERNSLDAMCCADSTLIIKTIIFLCLKIKILLYLTLQMLDYFCFALPDGVPPLICAQSSFLHLKKKTTDFLRFNTANIDSKHAATCDCLLSDKAGRSFISFTRQIPSVARGVRLSHKCSLSQPPAGTGRGELGEASCWAAFRTILPSHMGARLAGDHSCAWLRVWKEL